MIWGFYALLGTVLRVFEAGMKARAKRPLPGHTLYHFYVSPPCIRTRKAIYDLKLDIPFKEVLVDELAWKELVGQGGKDQVPCLRIEELGHSRWMYESADIIEYLRARAISQTGTLNLNASMD